MVGLLAAFWLTIGLDLSTWDFTLAGVGVGIYFAAPLPLHDKVQKIGKELGEAAHKEAVRITRAVRNFAVMAVPFFVAQPILTNFLGWGQLDDAFLLIWIEFFGGALFVTSGFYVGRFYNLMEKLPSKRQNDNHNNNNNHDGDEDVSKSKQTGKNGKLSKS